jgi:hypothetical protein
MVAEATIIFSEAMASKFSQVLRDFVKAHVSFYSGMIGVDHSLTGGPHGPF